MMRFFKKAEKEQPKEKEEAVAIEPQVEESHAEEAVEQVQPAPEAETPAPPKEEKTGSTALKTG